jgi:putative hydrolase of the HAD superfamily
LLKAVIWDVGGVLYSSPFEAFARYEVQYALPPGLIRQINATNPDTNAWAQFERSAIDAATFDARFAAEAALLGHALRGADVLPLLQGVPRPRMIAAAKLCKTKYKIGCITNNLRASNAALRGASSLFAMFDHVIESAEAGVRKPDPRIYEMMCEALAVTPSACLFLDDLGVNLKPARAMGMQTIKVVSEEQALAELAAATGLSFPAPSAC